MEGSVNVFVRRDVRVVSLEAVRLCAGVRYVGLTLCDPGKGHNLIDREAKNHWHDVYRQQ